MGILKSGILGPFHKKTGTAIGRRHRGLNLISALYRTGNTPRTAKQLEAQLKLGLLNSFLSDIDVLVNMGFKAYAKGKSAVNAAFSYNYKHAFVKEGDTFRINYPLMVYSRGPIVKPEAAQAAANAGHVTFSWQAQKQSVYCQYTDLASFLVYNPDKKSGIQLLTVANRYAHGYTIEMPTDYVGDRVHCYLNFASADGKLSGDSVYVGELVMM